MLEIEEMGVGRRIVEELTEGRHRSVESMSEEDLQAVDEMNQNWFLVWLRQMAVSLDQDERVVSVETPNRGCLREYGSCREMKKDHHAVVTWQISKGRF